METFSPLITARGAYPAEKSNPSMTVSWRLAVLMPSIRASSFLKRALKFSFIGQLLPEFYQHDVHNMRKVNLCAPSPILPCSGIIDHVRPRIGDPLPLVRLEGADESSHAPRNLLSELPAGEAHGAEIIACPDGKGARLSLHEPYRAVDRIIHMHHRKHRVFLEIAGIFLIEEGTIEDRNRIVFGSPTGLGFPANQPRIPDAPDIQAEFLEIVKA